MKLAKSIIWTLLSILVFAFSLWLWEEEPSNLAESNSTSIEDTTTFDGNVTFEGGVTFVDSSLFFPYQPYKKLAVSFPPDDDLSSYDSDQWYYNQIFSFVEQVYVRDSTFCDSLMSALFITYRDSSRVVGYKP